MRYVLIACLLLLPGPASALCRCTCVQGVMRPICQQTDLVEPICQGFCQDDVRPAPVVRPLAGGRPIFDPVTPFNPAPRNLQEADPDYNLDARGFPVGTPGLLTGAPGQSGGSSASGAASGGAASGR